MCKLCVVWNCSEGLACLLKCATKSKLLHGLSSSRRRPQASHLFFLDDSLLFCRATLDDCRIICSILHHYELVYEQQVNLDKSSFFSPNTLHETRIEIMGELDLKQLNSIDTYVGVPLAFERSKRAHLLMIKDRIEARIPSWKECQPSQTSKAILIQSVHQAIPLYFYGLFSYPKDLCA